MSNENCGHADHEYNPWAERHECCDSRYCRCPCDGAKEREERYAKWRADPLMQNEAKPMTTIGLVVLLIWIFSIEFRFSEQEAKSDRRLTELESWTRKRMTPED